MEFIDKDNLYGDKYNAFSLCEYTQEVALTKRLIDIAEAGVEKLKPANTWSFEGVCHSFAKTIVDYSKMAFDNVLLGHFHAVNMISRSILENCILLDILINNAEYDLWKYYLVYSYRATIYKAGRAPSVDEINRLQEMYHDYDIDEDFYTKQGDRKKPYIREQYGWTYKVNPSKNFSFDHICKIVDGDAEYHGFQMMSDYSHGTSLYMKMHSSVFVGDMMTMFVNLYIELYRMVTLYCMDTVDESFDEITDKLESIFYRFIEYEETVYG